MPRRRRPVTRTREQVACLFANAIEDLETRTLFNTITGTGTFEYKDGTNKIVRVAYQNVQAELVFARVDKNTNQVVLGDATPAFAQQEDGKDLFTIYVASAGPESFISVAEVPALTATNRPMEPFNGNVALTVFGRGGLVGVNTDGGSGGIYLGARTKDTPANIANEVNRPILTDQFFGLGILGPRRNGRLTAGLIVETGVDLGKFFWGGAISGQVTLGGSINTFYAGALLTGDTRGLGTGGIVAIPENFSVAGDVRDLIVMGSIGTHADSTAGLPVYQTGFEAIVHGTIGRVQSYGSIIGNIKALHDPAAPGLRFAQQEIEAKVLPGNRGSLTHFQGNDDRDFDFGDPNDIGQPRLGDGQADFFNDTFDTAQYLGTIDSAKLGKGSVNVSGRLQNITTILDSIDYYGVSLMAGQTVAIRLFAPDPFTIGLGDEAQVFAEAGLQVYDPDNRLVGSDSNNVDPTATLNTLFQFTADRPGVYRFAVNAALGDRSVLLANIDYQLQIQKVGTMTIGAINATNDIFGTIFGETQIESRGGDLGALFAGGTLANDTGPAPFDPSDIFADGGNIRSIDAAAFGYDIATNRWRPTFETYAGSIGLIRARTGIANLGTIFIHDGPTGIGGDLQLVEAPNNSLFMQLHADGSLGVARALNMATPFASIISVNEDEERGDGIIDLIDVSGDLGVNGAGGPQIATGPFGNVRYIHVGGTAFRDVFFGGGTPDVETFAPGEAVTFTDDSGTQMKLTPSGSAFNPDGTVNLNRGVLSVLKYGIRSRLNGPGGGGSVLVRLTSTAGVAIQANGQSGRGTAEIGTISADGAGTLIEDFNNGTPLNPTDDRLRLSTATTNTDLDVTFEGNAVTDIYEITFAPGAVNAGDFNSIVNTTGGEIVNTTINSVGELAANTLGLSKSSTGTRVEGLIRAAMNVAPAAVVSTDDVTPYTQQRIGILVNGDIVRARTSQGMGNFLVFGSIQEMLANADGVATPGVHEGINGPIMTQPGGVVTAGGGELRHINIGEGILPSGTGDVLFSGLFIHSRLGRLDNQGEGSDIRGDIVVKGGNLASTQRTNADGTITLTSLSPIGTIALTNGAILGADILVTTRFQNAREFASGPITFNNVGNVASEPVPEIGAIGLSGNGGIMAANFVCADIGTIEVKGGFGIFNSSFLSGGTGNLGNIITDGFGIRTCTFEGGGSMNEIVARGDGTRLATTAFSSSVRYSERLQFDPYSGYVLTELNDLHKYFGTTVAQPRVMKGDYGRSGIIDQVRAVGQSNLGLANAQQIKNTNLNFASLIDRVIVRDYVDTLLLTTGKLNFVSTGSDASNCAWNVSGPVGTVGIGGTWRGTSSLSAVGPNGQVGTFGTGRAMFGALLVTNSVSLVRVGTDFGAPGMFSAASGKRISAGIDVGKNLSQLQVKGSLLDGSTIWINNLLGLITLGGNVDEGAVISVKSLGGQNIGGGIFGEFDVRSEG